MKNNMKKTAYLLIAISTVLVLSACSQKEEGKATPNPVTDPGGYDQNAIDTKNQAEEDIAAATNQENKNQTDTLNNNNNNMNTNESGAGDNTALLQKYNTVVLKTSLGNIELKLDAANAPVTVGNFLKLASTGFYDGVKFHRVIKGFMIQGGDPTSKDETQKAVWGTGGPGYKFADELKGTETYPQGTLAMANAGPNTNGSQFFIVTASPSAPLPPNYTVFGNVVSGMEVALKIENVSTTTGDRPVDDVTINSTEVLKK